MRKCNRWAVGLVTSLVCVVIASPVSGQTIADGEFLDESWSHDLFVNHPSGTAVVTIERVATGGNPGAAHMGTQTFGSGCLWFAHLHVAAAYDPASAGPLTGVWFSIDFATIGGSGNCGAQPWNPEVGGGMILRQADDYFLSPDAYASPEQSLGWVTISADALTAVDFVRVESDGSFNHDVHPDFSESGGLLEFGYLSGNSTGQPVCYREWMADNFVLGLNGLAPVESVTWAALKVLYRPQ